MEQFIDYRVAEDDDGAQVGALLRQRLRLSTSLLRRLKHMEDGITLDGQRVTVRAAARQGQLLRIRAEAATEASDVKPVEGPLDIVFEDEHMLVINKPAGLPVHPSRGHYLDTLANRVVYYLGGGATFRAINRLDRGTSGLMCIAKSSYSAQLLGRQLLEKGIKRTYLAVCRGTGLDAAGTVDMPVARVPGRGIMRCADPAGQPAVTHYRRLAEAGGHTLVELRLETGRTHQIRVHMAWLGHPVAGDFMYGQELDWLDGHALHSARLQLRHPAGGQAMTLEAAAPEYFQRILMPGQQAKQMPLPGITTNERNR